MLIQTFKMQGENKTRGAKKSSCFYKSPPAKAINNSSFKQKQTGKYLQEGRVSVPFKFLPCDPMCKHTLQLTQSTPTNTQKACKHTHAHYFRPYIESLQLCLEVHWAVIYF